MTASDFAAAFAELRAEARRCYPVDSDEGKAIGALLDILQATVLNINRIAEALTPQDRGGIL